MTQLFIEKLGSSWAVGLGGDSKTAIQERFDSFYNREATNMEEPNWLNSTFCWFWTKPAEFKQGLINIELAKIVNLMDAKFNRSHDKHKYLTPEEPYVRLATERAEQIIAGATLGKVRGETTDRVNSHFYRVIEEEKTMFAHPYDEEDATTTGRN